MSSSAPQRHGAEDSAAPYWVTPQAARRALIALHAIALLAILIELIVPLSAGGHGAERPHLLDFPGSYALYGFLACVILVLLGIVLRRLVMRDEHYYDDSERQ